MASQRFALEQVVRGAAQSAAVVHSGTQALPEQIPSVQSVVDVHALHCPPAPAVTTHRGRLAGQSVLARHSTQLRNAVGAAICVQKGCALGQSEFCAQTSHEFALQREATGDPASAVGHDAVVEQALPSPTGRMTVGQEHWPHQPAAPQVSEL